MWPPSADLLPTAVTRERIQAGRLLFVEVQAVYLVLSKYEGDPSLTQKQIGTCSAWEEELAENDRPLSPREVSRMRHLLRGYVPASYCKIFPQQESGA
jgi:hypothetical protein